MRSPTLEIPVLLLLLLSVAQVLLLSHVCSGAFRVITPVLPGEDEAGGANAGFEHQLALFGRFDTVGDDLVAPLVLAPLTNRRACEPFNRTEMQQALEQSGVLTRNSMNTSRLGESESAGFMVDTEGIDGGGEPAFVLMAERGDCHFVEKVRYAQEASAVGVVIYNGEEGDDAAALPTMADDGTSGDIRVPSILIHHKDALKLMRMMETARTTVVLINWEVPNPDHRLDVALWFSSRSSPALHSFIETFSKVVQVFDADGNDETTDSAATAHMQFTPYYDVFEGSSWGCLGKEQTEAEDGGAPGTSHCEKLCIYDNKFCTYDPERDDTVGLDGKDVLEEDIRQLCVEQYAKQLNKTVLFWEYLTAFNSKCSPLDATANDFNDECSRGVQESLDILSDQIATCVSEQGESLLSAQIKAKHKFGVVTVPQFSVNDAPFRSSRLSCDEPISLATCAPLKMMCVGFEGNPSAPKACSEVFWSDSCFAPFERDDCGDCNLRDNTVLWNRKCAGCDGVPHSEKDLDECGVCGGTGSFDVCGRCLPQEDAVRDKSCLDCKGVPNGFAKRDVCGICDGHGSFDACGLCLDARDPRRQNLHCRVIEDPDAVKGKARITGIRSSQFRGVILESFQEAIGAVANVSTKDVLLKSVDDGRCNDIGDDSTNCVEVFFFIPCENDACRASTAKLLQDPSASLTVAMKMRAHLDEVAYGLEEAASIEHVHLHSISTMSTGISNNAMITEDAANSAMAAQNGLSSSTSWGIILGALCLAVLLAGFVALKARDDRIQRDFQQMFAAYTPLTSLDQEDDRENGLFA